MFPVVSAAPLPKTVMARTSRLPELVGVTTGLNQPAAEHGLHEVMVFMPGEGSSRGPIPPAEAAVVAGVCEPPDRCGDAAPVLITASALSTITAQTAIAKIDTSADRPTYGFIVANQKNHLWCARTS
jgi:hypothetical protein